MIASIRRRVAVTIFALLLTLLPGSPVNAVDNSDCRSTGIDWSVAGFTFLCGVTFAEADYGDGRTKLAYRPATDDYVFLGQSGDRRGLYSTSLTPETTYLQMSEGETDSSLRLGSDVSVHYESLVNQGGMLEQRVIWASDDPNLEGWSRTWSLADSYTWRPDVIEASYGYSSILRSDVLYVQRRLKSDRENGTFQVHLQNGSDIVLDYDADYFDVPQAALAPTTGTGYSAWVIRRDSDADKVYAYGFSDPMQGWDPALGTRVLTSESEIFALDYDGTEYAMLVANGPLIQLRGIDKFGTQTPYSSVLKTGTLTDMVATPLGTYVEMAMNEAATSRRLVFLPKSGFARVVLEDAAWAVSPDGSVAWAEQTRSGGYVIKEFSPNTKSSTTTSKLPLPALVEPGLDYLRDGRLWVSVPGLGSFIGRLSEASANPVIDTTSLQSWYDQTSFIDLQGEDLQSIVDLDCTTTAGACRLMIDEFQNAYSLRLSLVDSPVGDFTTSIAFQSGSGDMVVRSFDYKVRKPLAAALERDVIEPGSLVKVSGVSLDLITSATFGPSSEFVNPNVILDQSSTLLSFTAPDSLEPGDYTLKLFHPDKRGAGYPLQSMSLEATVSSQAPVFTSIRDNENTIAGEWVRIDGSNLSVVTGIRADGRDLDIEVQDDNSITFVAPIFPTAGVFPITAVTADGDVETGFNFVMTSDPVITGSGPNTNLNPGDVVRLNGVNLDRLTSVTVGGVAVTSTGSDGDSWFFTLPATLGVGEHAVTASWQGGDVPTDVTFTIGAAAAAPGGDDGEFSVWTKKISDTEVKMYAKNPIGAGKVVFKVNGEEYAWIRATSANDRKLRVVTEGPMTGVSYLVRTITLEPGKNALEFYLDGERIRRNTYSLR